MKVSCKIKCEEVNGRKPYLTEDTQFLTIDSCDDKDLKVQLTIGNENVTVFGSELLAAVTNVVNKG